jgi:glycosyltransferase involved in cell wall biosynthesis
MNTNSKVKLQSTGVDGEKIKVVYSAINKNLFYPTNRTDILKLFSRKPYVLISSNCKARKNPEKILDLIKFMPKVDFIIHGLNWDKTYRNKIAELANLRYIPFNSKRQPELMRNAHVFLSLSTLEGGPITLLEALASGTPVVTTRTGFSEDFVVESNGSIVEEESNIQEIADSVAVLMRLKERVFFYDLTGKELSWKHLGQLLYAMPSNN